MCPLVPRVTADRLTLTLTTVVSPQHDHGKFGKSSRAMQTARGAVVSAVKNSALPLLPENICHIEQMMPTGVDFQKPASLCQSFSVVADLLVQAG